MKSDQTEALEIKIFIGYRLLLVALKKLVVLQKYFVCNIYTRKSIFVQFAPNQRLWKSYSKVQTLWVTCVCIESFLVIYFFKNLKYVLGKLYRSECFCLKLLIGFGFSIAYLTTQTIHFAHITRHSHFLSLIEKKSLNCRNEDAFTCILAVLLHEQWSSEYVNAYFCYIQLLDLQPRS